MKKNDERKKTMVVLFDYKYMYTKQVKATTKWQWFDKIILKYYTGTCH